MNNIVATVPSCAAHVNTEVIIRKSYWIAGRRIILKQRTHALGDNFLRRISVSVIIPSAHTIT